VTLGWQPGAHVASCANAIDSFICADLSFDTRSRRIAPVTLAFVVFANLDGHA
jgi:hypothetical protein